MMPIYRRIDELGRIVIPKELRNSNNWNERDPIHIIPTQEGLFLKKDVPSCATCGSMQDLVSVGERQLCASCIEDFSKAKEKA